MPDAEEILRVEVVAEDDEAEEQDHTRLRVAHHLVGHGRRLANQHILVAWPIMCQQMSMFPIFPLPGPLHFQRLM